MNKKYSAFELKKPISFHIKSGRLWGLIGWNGADS